MHELGVLGLSEMISSIAEIFRRRQKILMEKSCGKETFEIILGREGELGNLSFCFDLFSLQHHGRRALAKKEIGTSLLAESFQKVLMLSNYCWFLINVIHAPLFRFTI